MEVDLLVITFCRKRSAILQRLQCLLWEGGGGGGGGGGGARHGCSAFSLYFSLRACTTALLLDCLLPYLPSLPCQPHCHTRCCLSHACWEEWLLETAAFPIEEEVRYNSLLLPPFVAALLLAACRAGACRGREEVNTYCLFTHLKPSVHYLECLTADACSSPVWRMGLACRCAWQPHYVWRLPTHMPTHSAISFSLWHHLLHWNLYDPFL